MDVMGKGIALMLAKVGWLLSQEGYLRLPLLYAKR